MLWHQVGRLLASTDCLQIDKEDSNLIVAKHCALTACLQYLQAQSGLPSLHSPSHLRWYALRSLSCGNLEALLKRSTCFHLPVNS